jgi:heptosyltransferase III
LNRPVEIIAGERVLVSRTDRIGDLILAVPFLETLKLRFPDIAIEALVSDYAAPVLEHNPHIGNIIPLDRERLEIDNTYRRELLVQLRERQYKTAVILYPERNITFLLWKAGIDNRLGSGRRLHSIFFNKRLNHSRKTSIKHECDYNLDFLAFFKPGETVLNPRVYLSNQEIVAARQLLATRGISEPFVIIHPGSGGSAENWPLEYYLSLYSCLTSLGIEVALTGSNTEMNIIEEASRGLALNPKSLAGATDLRTLAAILSLAQVVVAGSTGPLHLAAAVQTKVVGLYPSKKLISPLRWGPRGPGHIILQTPNDSAGMKSISIKTAEDAILRLLKKAE